MYLQHNNKKKKRKKEKIMDANSQFGALDIFLCMLSVITICFIQF
jgi:hypothetical protein